MDNKEKTKLLKEKISQYYEDDNMDNFMATIDVLLDCEFWIPCTSKFNITGKEDATEQEKYDFAPIKSADGVGLIPLIADVCLEENDEEPEKILIASTTEDLDTEEVVSVPFWEILTMALDIEELDAIIIDPQSSCFPIPQDMFEDLLSMTANTFRLDIDLGDITQSDAECIVNAANNTLLGGGGVDGAIHRAAGPKLLEECRTLNGCATGQAKITRGYDLKADYVIHTVGPIYSGKPRDAELLAACYINSLNLAREHNISSIAFPVISTGAYGYPLEEAVPVIIDAINEWYDENPDYEIHISIVCFNEKTQKAFIDYLDSNYCED